MCKENRDCFIALLVALLLCSAWGVLHGQESSENWYLISAPELLRLEQVSTSWEQDRQSWLSQVRQSKAELGLLNYLLSQERGVTQKLRISSEQSEAEKLILISSKNGEIAEWKEKEAAQKLKTAAEKLKTQKAQTISVILGSILAAFVIVAAVKLYLKVKAGGISSLLGFFRTS